MKPSIRAPRAFGGGTSEVFNTGIGIVVLSDWDTGRRSGWDYMAEVRRRLSDLPGVRAFPVMRQGLASSTAKPVQFVIGGASYARLAAWRDLLLAKIAAKAFRLRCDSLARQPSNGRSFRDPPRR